VHDCPAHGLLGADQDSGSLLLEYSEFFGSGSRDRYHQIYMATDEVAHPGSTFRMQHCYVHDGVGGNNVKSRAERNEIYYNWLEGGFYHELELIGPDPGGAQASWSEAAAREDSDVVGNVLWKGNTFSVVRFGGDATGQSKGRYRFVNNTVVTESGGSAVFRLFDGLESVEMHNNVFFGRGGVSVNLLREVEAEWTTGRVVGGSNNWVPEGASNVPPEWTGTLSGSNPGFVDISAWDLRPADTGALYDAGAASLSGPPGHAFPSPLTLPVLHPPQRLLEAPGSALARGADGTVDVGAYESTAVTSPPDAGSAGASDGGGAIASGGAIGSTGGAAATGGTAGSGGRVGMAGAGGNSSLGGAPTAGASNADAGVTLGLDAGVTPSGSSDEGSCGCRLIGRRRGARAGPWAFVAFVSLAARRRRR
jgi:hypothetical protein